MHISVNIGEVNAASSAALSSLTPIQVESVASGLMMNFCMMLLFKISVSWNFIDMNEVYVPVWNVFYFKLPSGYPVHYDLPGYFHPLCVLDMGQPFLAVEMYYHFVWVLKHSSRRKLCLACSTGLA